VHYFSYIRISVNSDPDVTEIAQKKAVSPKLSVQFFVLHLYVIRHFIQIIFENLVKGLFLKFFCEHLGGVAHKGRLQATLDVIQDGIVPPDQPSLVQCVFTMGQNMEQRLLHHVPTELVIDRSMPFPPSEVSEGGQRVYAAIHSKFQDTTGKVPHVGLPSDAFILSLQ
jgi:hypothetical protein